jgi:hypothetical protein
MLQSGTAAVCGHGSCRRTYIGVCGPPAAEVTLDGNVLEPSASQIVKTLVPT